MSLRMIGLGAVIVAAATISGCAPAVHLQSADISLPATFDVRKRAGPAGQDFSLDKWWPAFGDPQLDSLVDTALARSTTARLATSRLAEARVTRSVSRAGTLPTGNVAATTTEAGSRKLWGQGVNAGGSNTSQASFYPSWDLDLFGQLAATREQADVNYASSQLDFYAARLALAADVASSLFQARSAAIDLATAHERLEISERLAATARTGRDRGLTSGQDADRLESDLASARAEVPRLEAELQAAKRSLLILIGTPDAAIDTLRIEAILSPPPALPQAAPGLLLARRPDVLSAGLAVQSAALGVQIDRLALFPRFTIDPGVGLTATTGAVAGGTGLWSLAAGLTVPLLDRPRLMAQLRLTQAQGNSTVTRVDGLENAGVLSNEAIASRKFAARNSGAARAATEAQLKDLLVRHAHLTIRAPSAGLVLERAARPGDTSSTGTALFTMARDSLLELYAELPEASAAEIHVGDPARVYLASGRQLQGTVRLIGERVDTTTGLVIARIALPVDAELRQGGFAKATFTRPVRVATIPESAVRYDADGASIMVIDANARVHRRPVRTGRHAEGLVELREGPPAGTRVAVQGASFTLDGDTVRIAGAGK